MQVNVCKSAALLIWALVLNFTCVCCWLVFGDVMWLLFTGELLSWGTFRFTVIAAQQHHHGNKQRTHTSICLHIAPPLWWLKRSQLQSYNWLIVKLYVCWRLNGDFSTIYSFKSVYFLQGLFSENSSIGTPIVSSCCTTHSV